MRSQGRKKRCSSRQSMATLVACISAEKGTALHVRKLVDAALWDKVFLITAEPRERSADIESAHIITVNISKPTPELVEFLYNTLKDKITDIEVCVNFIAGSGKEHMALLAALLRLGVGIRL